MLETAAKDKCADLVFPSVSSMREMSAIKEHACKFLQTTCSFNARAQNIVLDLNIKYNTKWLTEMYKIESLEWYH